MTSVEFKRVLNRRDIFIVECLQRSKIKFERPRHKRDIGQCADYQKMCHLRLRCVRCAGEHPTNRCHSKESSCDVSCVLCGGNHPANYTGCAVCQELQQTHTHGSEWCNTLLPHRSDVPCTQPGIRYAQISEQHSHPPTNIAQEPHTRQCHRQTCDIQDLGLAAS